MDTLTIGVIVVSEIDTCIAKLEDHLYDDAYPHPLSVYAFDCH